MIGNGWIESGEGVPHSCTPCAPVEYQTCAYCGNEYPAEDYSWYTDLDDFSVCLKCRVGAGMRDKDSLAITLQNVLDGVHGAKDAARVLLAKWRRQ